MELSNNFTNRTFKHNVSSKELKSERTPFLWSPLLTAMNLQRLNSGKTESRGPGVEFQREKSRSNASQIGSGMMHNSLEGLYSSFE